MIILVVNYSLLEWCLTQNLGKHNFHLKEFKPQWCNKWNTKQYHRHAQEHIEAIDLLRFSEKKLILKNMLNVKIDSYLSDTEMNTHQFFYQKSLFSVVSASKNINCTFLQNLTGEYCNWYESSWKWCDMAKSIKHLKFFLYLPKNRNLKKCLYFCNEMKMSKDFFAFP